MRTAGPSLGYIRPVAKLILASLIPLLVGGNAPAQDEQRPPRLPDISSPVYINREPVYRVGGAVSAPRPVYTPDPEYSEEARKANTQGTVVLWLVVGSDGKPRSIRVARALGSGLDEKAIEAVSRWKFDPAMKQDKPVAVQMNVEITFWNGKNDCCQVDVLSDSMGIDFGPYLASVIRDVRSSWLKLIPNPCPATVEEVAVRFAILKDGRVAEAQVTSPGDPLHDRAAQDAITTSSPFKPLPSEFKAQELVIRMHFVYHSMDLAVVPASVRVASQSVHQFSAVMGPIRNPAVTWSLSGEGCSAAACGTISADGMYTAPVLLPIPPMVTLKATLISDPNKTASATVTIVKAPDPSQ